ncbi:MAG: hypothetical protein P4L53_23315 [Candidatus Obscuribacterales bacterium]|nr:hypothetical protein [Candidatus Obscuribacterales bacterium]
MTTITKEATTVPLPASGYEVVHLSDTPATCDKVLVLDIDYTVVDSTKIAATESRERTALAAGNTLPPDFFAQAGTDFATRVFDLSNMAEAIIWLTSLDERTSPELKTQLLQFTPEQVLTQFTVPHHKSIRLIESSNSGLAYDGVNDVLRNVRTTHPDAAIIAHTDCPAWLALLRLHHAGLLQYYTGVMGVSVQRLPWLESSEYAASYIESQRFVKGVFDEMLALYPNLKVVVAADKPICKPSHVGLQVALSKLNVTTDAVLFHIDDKPIGAKVIQGLKEASVVTNSTCLHAAYGYPKAADWTGIDVSLTGFAQAESIVLKAFNQLS